jgi:hypothetical protein
MMMMMYATTFSPFAPVQQLHKKHPLNATASLNSPTAEAITDANASQTGANALATYNRVAMNRSGFNNFRRLVGANFANVEEYIMFSLGRRIAGLTPALTAQNRTPILFTIGAPTAFPPRFYFAALNECNELETPAQAADHDFEIEGQEPFKIAGLNAYSNPEGEMFFKKAVVKLNG